MASIVDTNNAMGLREASVEPVGAADAAWMSIRKTEGMVIDKHLIPYTTQELPEIIWVVAWEDFLLEEELMEGSYWRYYC
jgi:hypothetical protein